MIRNRPQSNELTELERKVAMAICMGISAKETARILEITPTMQQQLRVSIYDKTGLSGRQEVALQLNAAVRTLFHERITGPSIQKRCISLAS